MRSWYPDQKKPTQKVITKVSQSVSQFVSVTLKMKKIYVSPTCQKFIKKNNKTQ